MAIRMPFPSDVTPSPDAHYHRTQAEAFPCDANEAVAFQSYPARKHPGRWLALVLIAVVALALAGCSRAKAQEMSESPTDLRRAASAAWLCPGMTAVWIDETTAQCLKEKP